jgi:hypothetical protein
VTPNETATPAPTETPTPTATETATPTATDSETATGQSPEEQTTADRGDETSTTGQSAETGESTGERETVTVVNASLNRTELSPGDVVLVTATIRNTGDTNTSRTIQLLVNGTEVTTQTHTIAPGETRRVQFRYRTNRTGEFPVQVRSTSAGTLSVTQGGGLIPWRFLRAGFLFLVVPVALIYGVLKALAIYYGY